MRKSKDFIRILISQKLRITNLSKAPSFFANVQLVPILLIHFPNIENISFTFSFRYVPFLSTATSFQSIIDEIIRKILHVH